MTYFTVLYFLSLSRLSLPEMVQYCLLWLLPWSRGKILELLWLSFLPFLRTCLHPFPPSCFWSFSCVHVILMKKCLRRKIWVELRNRRPVPCHFILYKLSRTNRSDVGNGNYLLESIITPTHTNKYIYMYIISKEDVVSFAFSFSEDIHFCCILSYNFASNSGAWEEFYPCQHKLIKIIRHIFFLNKTLSSSCIN